jgi:lipopolysaccharide biosynthesis glycosyltransferase
MDSDHIVLHNIDRIFGICNDAICAVNDPTQSVKKMWDKHYFNAGLMLLQPDNKDYFGLLDAIFNNTLTSSKKKTYDYDALSDLESFPKHSWITGGKAGSLLEQDLLNIYFITRVTYLAPGYNIWAKKLDTFMVPGAFYETQEEVDKFVSPRVHVIHGNLWSVSDGYGYNFPLEMRLLWLKYFKSAVHKIHSDYLEAKRVG